MGHKRLVIFRSSIKLGENVLSDFEHGMVDGTSKAGWIFLEAADFLGFSWVPVYRLHTMLWMLTQIITHYTTKKHHDHHDSDQAFTLNYTIN